MNNELENSPQMQKGDPSPAFLKFLAQLEAQPDPVEKIRLYFHFMRSTLAQEKGPNFKDFWEARRQCILLLKEAGSQNPSLWSEYSELSSEARRLKELVEEEAAFASEQIELALSAIEADIQRFAELSAAIEMPFPDLSRSLAEKRDLYLSLQKELYLLNTLAARVQGLRKEVLKTALRPKVKNKLLSRLSVCGDNVFPRRKELIQKVSEQFVLDVQSFVDHVFPKEEQKKPPLYVLKDDIKMFQNLAKHLTLSASAFHDTRQKLSQCWDVLKEWDKERREQYAEKRELARVEDAEMQKKRQEEEEKAREKREKITHFKEQLKTFFSEMQQKDVEVLVQGRDQLLEVMGSLPLTKAERQVFERQFKAVKDLISEKKEKKVMAFSEDQKQAVEQLEELLQERKEERQEIKQHIEGYRKALGSSGFDFEKAILYRELMEADKERLQKAEAAIQEIEDKLDQLGT